MFTLDDYDAIIVPGLGGPRDQTAITSSLPIWVRAKLDTLIKLYKEQDSQVPIVTLSAGSYHTSPVYDKTGRPILECTAMALYLQSAGLTNIYEETASYDTVGNAFYLRSIHCEPRQWRKLLIVVNDFHQARVKIIFDWIFGLGQLTSKEYCLDYWTIPLDDDIDQVTKEIIESRKIRETTSIKFISNKIIQLNLTSWGQFHQWFFNEHDLYRSNNRACLIGGDYGVKLEEKCRQSY